MILTLAYAAMVDETAKKALRGIAWAESLQPPEGPITLSTEYLRLIERVENLVENCDGADKAWTERALSSWQDEVQSAREIRRA